MQQKVLPIVYTMMSLVAAIFLLGISLGLLVSCLKAYHPAFDSFVHIRIYLLGLLVAPMFLLWIQPAKRKWILAVFIVLFLGIALQFSDLKKLKTVESYRENDQSSYSLMQINLRFDNLAHELFLQRVADKKPDFITYEEASIAWQPVLNQLQENYPYRIECKRLRGPIGHTGILSRHPFMAGVDIDNCPLGEAMAQSVFMLNNKPITIRAFHLPWPWPHNQNQIIGHLERYFLAHPAGSHKIDYQINAGDYNATSTSFAVYRLAKMTDTQTLRPVGSTWLFKDVPYWARPILGLSIDQIQSSENISITDFSLLPTIGSDHIPLFVNFQLL